MKGDKTFATKHWRTIGISIAAILFVLSLFEPNSYYSGYSFGILFGIMLSHGDAYRSE